MACQRGKAGALLQSKLVVEDADPERASEHLLALADWLRYEEDLRGKARLEHAEVASEQMGGLPQALVVAVSAGGTVTVLARSVVEWMKQRKSDVTVKAVKPTGESFEIDLRRVSDPDVVVIQLCEFLSREQPDAEPDETAGR
ncbi:effector-associated constant component EACC1 [Streptomyces phaeochromogenes]|uniref:effector-associated constant component EACC1 n=1 Tax=Streptomyces phaeochromogenes TaxID=1923 RepID=UPI0037151C2C